MLSFTLNGKHMSYAYTHLNHKTITNIRIFKHSYNELIQLLKLIYNKLMLIRISHRSYKSYYPYLLQSLYWYFLSYTCSELTLIADLFLFGTYTYNIMILYLFRSYTHGRLILILISRRTQIYLNSLYTVLNLYIYLDGGTYHVLILLSIIYWFRALVGVTELTLIQRYLYTYWYLYLSQISRRSLQNLHLYRGTLSYYKDITERILVLRNLSLYGSTRKYYLFKCPKRHIFVLISNLYI